MFERYSKVLRQAISNWSEDGGPLLSAGVAYYIAISVFPAFLVLVAGLGWMFDGTELGEKAELHFVSTVSQQVSPGITSQLESVIGEMKSQARVGGPVGFLMLLITSLVMFTQFDKAFDRIWNIERTSGQGLWNSVFSTVKKRLKAFLMMICAGTLIAITFATSTTLSMLEQLAGNTLPWSGQVNRIIELSVSFVFNLLVFTLIYRLLPKVKVRWHHAVVGGVFAAIAWEIGRQVLSTYVITTRYSNAYGVIGSFMAVMLWAYYAVSVLFFGAEIVQAWRTEATKKS